MTTNLGEEEISIIDFPSHQDLTGNLTVIHGGKDIPFHIARVYFLTGINEGSQRGGHAHRSLRQLILAVSGSFVVSLRDGRNRREVLLDDPSRGLYLPKMWWRDLHSFSPGAVCLVFADKAYDEADYIRDYELFLAEAQ